MKNLTEICKVVGALAPVDKAGNAWVSKPIKLNEGQQVVFLVYLGAEDSTGTITVEKGVSASLGTAIGFSYQKASTGAAAFSELDGALTAVADTGLALTGSDDNKIIAITVKSPELAPGVTSATNYNYVGVKVGASGSANLVAIIALVFDERYAQAIPLSAV